MSGWPWWAIGLATLAGLYVAFVLTFLLIGRREQARALAGFVPDCLVLFTRLIRDPRVPRKRRWILIGLVGYLATPIDLVPDFIPVVGVLDDAIITVLALRVVLRGCSRDVLEEQWPGPVSSLEALARAARLAH